MSWRLATILLLRKVLKFFYINTNGGRERNLRAVLPGNVSTANPFDFLKMARVLFFMINIGELCLKNNGSLVYRVGLNFIFLT